MKKGLLCLSLIFLSGCLKTRSEVKDTEQRQNMQQTVVSLQKNNADVTNRFSEQDEDMRALRGRIEVLENKLNMGQNEADSAKKVLADQNVDTNRKFSLVQETLTKMEAQIQQQNAEIAALKAEHAAAQANAIVQKESASHSKKNSYEAAEEYFAQKDWKKAILSYQKYRDENPKGKFLPHATLRIAVSFQELGMKEEAKTFLDEVVAKYPNSDEAKKAKALMKSRKK